jgi:hypothetical protein
VDPLALQLVAAWVWRQLTGMERRHPVAAVPSPNAEDRTMRTVLLTMCAVCVACGQRPEITAARAAMEAGVITDRLDLVKTHLGPSPPDLVARVVDGRSNRLEQLVGDGAPERLVRLAFSDTIEVRNVSGMRVGSVTMPFHITDFGTTSAADGVSQLVVSMYPNARKSSTYAVFDSSLREVTRWEEFPVTSRFATASWRRPGQPVVPAVFYLQGDRLVTRTTDGRLLARLPPPGGEIFSEVHVIDADAARLVLVASGNGYTPFHLVAVYEEGQLVFHEIGDGHAFELSPAANGFVVSTRSARWEYREPGAQ